MVSRISDLIVKTPDPARLSRFWCQALGYEVTVTDETGVAISGASNAPTILFERSSDSFGDNSLHLDLCPTDLSQADELERLVALGATKTDVVPSGSWHVLADPDGNKFCLMAKRIPAEPDDFHDLAPTQSVTETGNDDAGLRTTVGTEVIRAL